MSEAVFNTLTFTFDPKNEIWLYKKEPISVSDFTRGEWLKKSNFGSLQHHVQDLPKAGLSLIVEENSKADETSTPFPKEIRKEIGLALGLPTSADYLLMGRSSTCCKIASKSGDPVFIYHRVTNFAAISAALRYDRKTNQTFGYLFHEPEFKGRLDDIIKNIEEAFPDYGQPLLLPIMIGEMISSKLIMENLAEVHESLDEIESESGFGVYTSGRSKCLMQDADHGYVVLLSLVAKFGRMSSKAAYYTGMIEYGMEATKFTLQELKLMEQDTAYDKIKPTTKRLVERAEVELSKLKHMRFYASLKPRMDAQQNALFNLLTQSMASDAKADSTFMTYITTLTALFLPATFLATLFAMPLFKWDASSMSEVTTEHFWVYWAITVPLTVVAVLALFLIHRLQRRELDCDVEGGKRDENKSSLNGSVQGLFTLSSLNVAKSPGS